MERIITLTTDFGLKDPWVGAMKGAILSVNPRARIVDISHLVTPQNIIEGSFMLSAACGYFPDKTIHLGVVDPGVGTDRRPILIETDCFVFVGPDNGLFTSVMEAGIVKRIVHLTSEDYFSGDVSSTFHGRDVFGPVAAHVSLGVKPEKLGPSVDDPVRLDLPSPTRTGETLTGIILNGIILYIDAFGNLITNISSNDLSSFKGAAEVDISIKDHTISGISGTYLDNGIGEERTNKLTALLGSLGRLEIASPGGSAKEALGADVGDLVEVRGRLP